MRTGSGRPRRACSTCKNQKIRCSGEKPVCQRCFRLKHNCVYANPPPARFRKSTLHQLAPAPEEGHSLSSTASWGSRPAHDEELSVGQPSFLINASTVPTSLAEEQYLDVPKSLISTLVEVYFKTAYNATLLSHKKSFIRSLDAGTVRPHTILSFCAWGANFYRDENGKSWLKDHGFIANWLQRAAQLAFKEVEEFRDDTIVTFLTVALLWHSQGSWRNSYLYKGIAYQMLSIMGLGTETMHTDNSWESESRRRRLWACYLMHCHDNGKLSSFEPLTTSPNLPLPCPEDEFEAGLLESSPVTLNSTESNGGIYAELVKVLTLWTSVISSIKSLETSLAGRISDIQILDERLSKWWHNLPQHLKLTPSNISATDPFWLPKILLLNLVYHQCFCTLHASIVPLFCWTKGDENWSLARKSSAQIAYEHACTVSALINAVLSHCSSLTNMPTFVSYTAYCGCAIQIPFMWSADAAVRQRANINVRANIRIIKAMATSWKFADLLRVHVGCLYNIHRRRHIVLEGEPMNVDIQRLTGFKINAKYARTSILEFNGVLRRKDGGLAKPDQVTNDLGIEDDGSGSGSRSQAMMSPSDDYGDGPLPEDLTRDSNQPTYNHSLLGIAPESSATRAPLQGDSQFQSDVPNLISSQPRESAELEQQTLDVFQPFFDPAMLDLFPNGDIPDLSGFDKSPLDLDYFEFESWQDNTGTVMDSRDDGAAARYMEV